VPDAIFTHPRLAPLYDAFDGDRDDLAAYLGIADELSAERVLDAGCGTGSLACGSPTLDQRQKSAFSSEAAAPLKSCRSCWIALTY
jgi:SAM-dependent methyltransferase